MTENRGLIPHPALQFLFVSTGKYSCGAEKRALKLTGDTRQGSFLLAANHQRFHSWIFKSHLAFALLSSMAPLEDMTAMLWLELHAIGVLRGLVLPAFALVIPRDFLSR
jgi:hypothetical protein